MSSREGKAFTLFHFSPFLPEPARQPKSAAERSEPQTPSWTLPASPNMAQTPLCGSAVPMRRFPPVSDLKDAISACIPPRQRKNFAVARLLEAGGVLEAISDAHGRHDVPVALPTTANAGDCHVDGSCCVLGPPASRNHAPVRDYRAETSRTQCDRSCKNARERQGCRQGARRRLDGDETAQNVAERPR
jgi:hypothetical protein